MSVQLRRTRRQLLRFHIDGSKDGGKLLREQRVAVMDEILLPQQEAIPAIGEVSSRLRHPRPIGVMGDAAEADFPRGDVFHEQDVISDQPVLGENLRRGEVAGRDDVPVDLDELLPVALAHAAGVGVDAVVREDLADGRLGNLVAEVVHVGCDPQCAPLGIFRRHVDDQLDHIVRDLLRAAPLLSIGDAVVFAAHEFPVPFHDGVRREGVFDRGEDVGVQPCRLLGEPPPLRVVKPRLFLPGLAFNDLLVYPQFLAHIVDGVLQIGDDGLLVIALNVLEECDKTLEDFRLFHFAPRRKIFLATKSCRRLERFRSRIYAICRFCSTDGTVLPASQFWMVNASTPTSFASCT